MEHTLEAYALIDQEIKLLTEKKEKLRDDILAGMNDAGEDKIEGSVGKFSITKLKKWVYPEEVLEIGEQFKAEKAKAESMGTATYTEQDSLRFTAVKL